MLAEFLSAAKPWERIFVDPSEVVMVEAHNSNNEYKTSLIITKLPYGDILVVGTPTEVVMRLERFVGRISLNRTEQNVVQGLVNGTPQP